MSAVKDFNIVITRDTAAITREGFGLPLILGTGGVESYAECTTLAEVDAAGFSSATEVYKLAQAVFAQSPAPPKVAVAGIEKTLAQSFATMTATSTAAFKVTATVGGPYDGLDGNGWVVEIVDVGVVALSAAIDVPTKTITVDLEGATRTAEAIAIAVDGLAGFDAEEVLAGNFTVADDEGKEVTLSGGTNGSESISAGLDNIIDTNNNWYFLLTEERNTDEILLISAWAGANGKLYFVAPDQNVAETIALAISANSARTAVIWHNDNESYADAAWVGEGAPHMPGSRTWKFKSLAGVEPATATVTQIGSLHDDNVNTYIRKYGVSQTSDGKLSNGEYIDVIHFQDLIEARLNEAVHGMLVRMPKIPFTNEGISMVAIQITSVLEMGVSAGGIATGPDGSGIYTVTVPDVDDVPDNDKANRHLPDVHFTFKLAGAIHGGDINGVISV